MISLIISISLSGIIDPEFVNHVDLIEINQYDCVRGDSGLWQLILWNKVGDTMRIRAWKQVYVPPGSTLPVLPSAFGGVYRYEFTNYEGSHIIEAPEWILSSSNYDPESVDRTMGDVFRKRISPVRRSKVPTQDYSSILHIFKRWRFMWWVPQL